MEPNSGLDSEDQALWMGPHLVPSLHKHCFFSLSSPIFLLPPSSALPSLHSCAPGRYAPSGSPPQRSSPKGEVEGKGEGGEGGGTALSGGSDLLRPRILGL